MRNARKLGAALVLVALGRLLSPMAIPVYDGINAPDEPYRYVSPPPGTTKTAPPTIGEASSPLVNGRTSYGMSVSTAESGPQFSLFVPPQSFAAAKGPVVVRAVPQAPADEPTGAKIDGDVYLVTVTAASGPVTLTDKNALSTLYLRATSAKQPGPVMEYRTDPTKPWKQLQTSRGGQDVYVSSFPGAGQYALAFLTSSGSKKGGSSPLPYVLLGGLVLLTAIVVVIRLRAAE